MDIAIRTARPDVFEAAIATINAAFLEHADARAAAALAAELEQHIKSTDEQNRKNGATSKTVKSASGSFQLDTPRDRNGTFEPQLVKKGQTWLMHLTIRFSVLMPRD